VDGLERKGDNLYSTSAASGLAQTGAPGSAGLGNIAGQAVEMSNTDLTSAFLEMLVTQRAYQASTRVISTANELIEEAIRMTQ
jgi:flagellar hook protein FlgE